MKVRILVDVPRLGLACGVYVDLDKADADSLIASGQADPNAPWPDDIEQPMSDAKRQRKQKHPEVKK